MSCSSVYSSYYLHSFPLISFSELDRIYLPTSSSSFLHLFLRFLSFQSQITHKISCTILSSFCSSSSFLHFLFHLARLLLLHNPLLVYILFLFLFVFFLLRIRSSHFSLVKFPAPFLVIDFLLFFFIFVVFLLFFFYFIFVFFIFLFFSDTFPATMTFSIIGK